MPEPAVTVQAFHVSDGSNLPIVRVVIHATSPPNLSGTLASTAGMASDTARYFQGSDSGGSAQYVCDVGGEEHCVAEDKIAWHAPPNRNSIGIEVCGLSTYTREQWLSAEVWPAVERAALRARDVCDRQGLPWHRLTVSEVSVPRKGVCGHVDVTDAFHQSDHTDPGPNFPWDEFMAVGDPTTPAQPQEDDDMPLSITITDPTTHGTWTCRVSDGAVFADAGAPFLGGYNGHPDWGTKEPVAGFALWKDDAGKWGYKVITAGADALHFYRFPRSGVLA